jgi:hypothetical protein
MFRAILPIASILALTMAPAAVLAKSPRSRVEKLLSKYTVPEDDVFAGKFKPRSACVCTATGSADAFAGFLIRTSSGKVACAAGITYDAQGQIQTYAPCGDFEVLSR